MTAFIPEIGTKLKIEEDWTFTLFQEYRNKHICLADGRKCDYRTEGSYERTLPAGSEFMVDRIYVRQGAKTYSSVTLYVLSTADKVLTKKGTRTQPFKHKGAKHYGRFWVKLTDFNDAKFVVTEDTSISGTPTEHRGEPVTLAIYKRRKNIHYWVKFEHGDPELCFEGNHDAGYVLGPIYSFADDNYRPRKRHDLIAAGYTEKVSYSSGATNYTYFPPHFARSLVPESWTTPRAQDSRYRVKRSNPMSAAWYGANFPDVYVIEHPLEAQLHIPKDKKVRVPMGLVDDKSLIENISVAGGKLTIYNIEVR